MPPMQPNEWKLSYLDNYGRRVSPVFTTEAEFQQALETARNEGHRELQAKLPTGDVLDEQQLDMHYPPKTGIHFE